MPLQYFNLLNEELWFLFTYKWKHGRITVISCFICIQYVSETDLAREKRNICFIEKRNIRGQWVLMLVQVVPKTLKSGHTCRPNLSCPISICLQVVILTTKCHSMVSQQSCDDHECEWVYTCYNTLVHGSTR